jgi:hypothetical protein
MGNAVMIGIHLEDWYEELSDESLNPENILIADEDEPVDIEASLSCILSVDNENYPFSVAQTLENKMTHSVKSSSAFDIKQWVKTATVLAGEPEKKGTKVYPCPDWLTLAAGSICANNGFIVTAGIVKATRKVLDAIGYTRRQYEAATENLLIQELRATRQAPEKYNFGPEITRVGLVLAKKSGALDAPGLNPDGFEFTAAYEEAVKEVDKLEAVLANGERIISEILTWITDNADDLELTVETGHTVKLGPIGNEIRTARYEPLTPDTLLYGVQAQREFIRKEKLKHLTMGIQQNGVQEIPAPAIPGCQFV